MTRAANDRRRRLEALSRLTILRGCTPDELDRIDRAITRVDVRAGTTLTAQGAGARQAMIIAEGTAEVARDGAAIDELGPGSILGEMALLVGTVRSATVRARTPMTLFVLTAGEFHGLLAAAPGFASAVSRTAESRAQRATPTSAIRRMSRVGWRGSMQA